MTDRRLLSTLPSAFSVLESARIKAKHLIFDTFMPFERFYASTLYRCASLSDGLILYF